MGRELLVQRRLAFADRRAAGGEYETSDAVMTAGLEVVQCSDDIGETIAARIGDRRPHPGICRKMDNDVDPRGHSRMNRSSRMSPTTSSTLSPPLRTLYFGVYSLNG